MLKKLLFVISLLLLVPFVFSEGLTFFVGEGESINPDVNNNDSIAMEFNVVNGSLSGYTYNITKVAFYYTQNISQGDVNVSLWVPRADGLPNGTLLNSTVISTVGFSDAVWVNVTLGASSLSYNAVYVFMLSTNDPLNHFLTSQPLGDYVYGHSFEKDVRYDSDWVNKTVDMMFRVYGNNSLLVSVEGSGGSYTGGDPSVLGIPSLVYVPPLSQVWEFVKGGGSFKQALQLWSPSAYLALVEALPDFYKTSDPLQLMRNVWDIFVLMIQYTFREPAALVPLSNETALLMAIAVPGVPPI